jgi:glutamate dehydrogenase/leucine dehydrogenase
VVAISEERGAVRSAAGIDVEKTARHLRRTGTLHDGGTTAATDDFHELDCDLLALGGSESALNGGAAARLRAKIVIETSELIVTPSADRMLASRGVVVVPDLIGAAGSVLAANREWSNNVQRLCPDEGSLKREIEGGLLRAYEQMMERSRRERVSARLAAYSAAIERVARCERLRVA